jgi:hypothetical protein
MASKWRRELAPEVAKAILRVVADSAAFRSCSEQADWG